MSCNLEDRGSMFTHSAASTAAVAVSSRRTPDVGKLSPGAAGLRDAIAARCWRRGWC